MFSKNAGQIFVLAVALTEQHLLALHNQHRATDSGDLLIWSVKRRPPQTASRLRRLQEDELFPDEQNRIVQLLVERVEVYEDGLELRLHGDGLRSLVTEIKGEEAAG